MEQIQLAFLIQRQGQRLVVEVTLYSIYWGGPIGADASIWGIRSWLLAMQLAIGRAVV